MHPHHYLGEDIPEESKREEPNRVLSAFRGGIPRTSPSELSIEMKDDDMTRVKLGLTCEEAYMQALMEGVLGRYDRHNVPVNAKLLILGAVVDNGRDSTPRKLTSHPFGIFKRTRAQLGLKASPVEDGKYSWNLEITGAGSNPDVEKEAARVIGYMRSAAESYGGKN